LCARDHGLEIVPARRPVLKRCRWCRLARHDPAWC
jgi:hypothetical protein